MSMMQSGVELTITTFGTLLIAGAEAHDYSLVQQASSAGACVHALFPSHQCTAAGGHLRLGCFCFYPVSFS